MRTYLPAPDLELNFEIDVGGEGTHWIFRRLDEGEEGLDQPLLRRWFIVGGGNNAADHFGCFPTGSKRRGSHG